jgi:thiosulfate dehydrogenase [quinone] large subunit
MNRTQQSWLIDVSLAYALLRIALGLNICMHGIVRWTAGLRPLAESLVSMFQHTALPSWSVYSFGLVLPVLEALIGSAVLLGFRARYALTAGAILMLALTFGSTLRQDWQVSGIQLTYSFMYSVLIATSRFNGYSLDRISIRQHNNL